MKEAKEIREQLRREERACRSRERVWADKDAIVQAILAGGTPFEAKVSHKNGDALSELRNDGHVAMDANGKWFVTPGGRYVFLGEGEP